MGCGISPLAFRMIDKKDDIGTNGDIKNDKEKTMPKRPTHEKVHHKLPFIINTSSFHASNLITSFLSSLYFILRLHFINRC